MSAKFWYYPQPNGGNLVEIDLGEELGELFTEMVVEAVDAVSFAGGIQRSVGPMREMVSIQRDRLLLGEDLAYQFMALQNHLDRGFSCAFSADHTKAWAAPLMSPGVKKVTVHPNPFTAFTGSVIPASNDYIVIETPNPGMLQEMHKLDSVASLSAANGGSATIDDRLNFQHSNMGQSRSFVRWYRFWPVLKRPQGEIGRNIVTNEGGRLFSLNLTLTPDYRTYFAYHPDTWGVGVSPGDMLVDAYTGSGDIPQGRQGGGIDGTPRRFDVDSFAQETEEPLFDGLNTTMGEAD